MAGKLGSDFDTSEPADSNLVSEGAREIRDIKSRLKSFISFLYNPETMKFRKGAIISDYLKPASPNPNGTHRQIVVNSRGFVTSGTIPDDLSAPPVLNRAWFFSGASPAGYQDNARAFSTISTPGVNTYAGTGVYDGTYASGSTYHAYTWTVPANVRRVTAYVCGGGGGAATNGGAARFSGAAGEYREASLSVTPETDISIVVGNAGDGEYNVTLVTDGTPGGTSRVSTGDSYLEAAGGGGASTTAVGSAQIGVQSADIKSILLPGVDGVSAGDYFVNPLHYWYDSLAHDNGENQFGAGGFANTSATEVDGHPGFVMLEWVE